MQYELLEEVPPLQITLDGATLDAITVGVLQVQLQEMTDKVTYSLLAREQLFEQQRAIRPRRLYFIEDDRILKAQIRNIRMGSPLQQDVTFAVLSVLDDPDVRSVLLGVASNIIYGIAVSGVKGIVRRTLGRFDSERPRRIDPFNLSTNARTLLRAMAANSNGGKMTLRLAHQKGDERFEIELVVERQQ